MDKNLIIDVGMHVGKDTEFYLKKGFKVVAIEANSELVAKAKVALADYINAGRLVIHNIAIASYKGQIDFYVNNMKDDWGTISKEFAHRNEGFGTTNQVIKVGCTTLQEILKDSGIPYYLKIDVEGADTLCLSQLSMSLEKPQYISIEAGLTSFEETFDELSWLWQLGYREFKIVNQAVNSSVRCPNPPLEGNYVDCRFDGYCSGPFGEEAPGKWLGIEQTFDAYRRILFEQRYFGAAGKFYRTIFHRMFEKLKREPVGWYDFHAKLGIQS